MHGRTPFAFPLTADLPVLFPTSATASVADGVTGRQVANFNTPPHVTGGGHPAAPNGGAGAGNLAGSLDDGSRPLLGLLILLGLWLVIAVVAMGICSLVGGCTAAQESGAGASLTRAAGEGQQASTFLVGSATTRPSPVVGVVEAVAPITTPYITAAGTAIAIGSAGLAALGTWLSNKGTINSLATQVVDHRSAIAEVVGDIRSYVQPTVPYSHTTAKLVADVAGLTAAAPASALADITLTPMQTAEVPPVTSKPVG